MVKVTLTVRDVIKIGLRPNLSARVPQITAPNIMPANDIAPEKVKLEIVVYMMFKFCIHVCIHIWGCLWYNIWCL